MEIKLFIETLKDFLVKLKVKNYSVTTRKRCTELVIFSDEIGTQFMSGEVVASKLTIRDDYYITALFIGEKDEILNTSLQPNQFFKRNEELETVIGEMFERVRGVESEIHSRMSGVTTPEEFRDLILNVRRDTFCVSV